MSGDHTICFVAYRVVLVDVKLEANVSIGSASDAELGRLRSLLCIV